MASYVYQDGTGWVPLTSSSLPASGVAAGTYGDGTHVGRFTVDAHGIVTAASNVVITGGGGGGGGTVFDYVEFVGDRLITATTPASAQAIVDGGAVTYDGITEVEIMFSCRFASVNAGGYWIANLWDGGTDLGRFAQFHGTAGGDGCPVGESRFLTPSAGSHTFHVKGWVAGPSQATFTGNNTDPGLPMYLRIVGA